MNSDVRLTQSRCLTSLDRDKVRLVILSICSLVFHVCVCIQSLSIQTKERGVFSSTALTSHPVIFTIVSFGQQRQILNLDERENPMTSKAHFSLSNASESRMKSIEANHQCRRRRSRQICTRSASHLPGTIESL